MTSTFESYSKIGQIFSENIDDLIFIINDKHQCEYVNFKDSTSRKKINEFIHPDDFKRVNKLLKNIFKTGYGIEDVQIRYNDKPFKWFEIKGKSFIDNEDNKKKAFLIGRDITKCKSLEFEVKRSQARFGELTEYVPEIQFWKLLQTREGKDILQKTEQMLELVLDNIPQLIYWKDTNLIYMGCNKNFALANNITEPMSIIGSKDEDLIWFRDNINYIKNKEIEIMRNDHAEYNVIESLNSIDDKQTWFEINRIPLHDPKGKVVGILVTYEDITVRKISEQKLKESEKKYRGILENIKEIYFEVDLKGNFTFFNDAFVDLIGYSKSELLSTNYRNFVDEENKNKIFKVYNEVYQTSIPKSDFQFQFPKKNGELVICESSVYLRYDSRGNKIGFSGLARDITDKYLLEQKIKDSETKYRHLFKSSPYSIILINRKGIIIDCNPATERIFNRKIDSLINKNFLEISIKPERALPLFKERYQKVLKGTVPEPLEVQISRSKDGTLRWISIDDSLVEFEGETVFQVIIQDITEKKKSEQELKKSQEELKTLNRELEQKVLERTRDLIESEQQYRTTINSLNDPLHVVDRELNIILSNEAFSSWLQDLEIDNKIVGQNVFQAFPFLPDEVRSEYEQVFKTGKTLITEGSIFLNNLEIFTETRKIPIFSEDKVSQVLTIIRDITESKKMENQLIESEQQYRATIDSLNDPLHVIDRDLRIMLKNKELKKWLFELDLDEDILGKQLSEAFPFLPDKVYKEYREVFETGKPLISIETTILPYSNIITETRKIPIYSEGKVSQIITIIRDISERKKMEDQLKESEKKFRDMITNLDEGYYMVQWGGNIIYHNPAFSKIAGYDSNENLIGQPIPFYWQNSEDQEKYRRELQKNGTIRNYIFPIKKKDGENIVVQVNAHLIRHDNNKPMVIEGTFSDITEKFRLEQELLKSEKKLREQNIELRKLDEVKNDFITMAAHELKTPLISISGYTDYILMKHRNQINPEITTDLLTVQRNIKRLEILMDQLLDVLKIDENELKLHKQSINVSNVINNCLDELSYLINEKNLEIILNIDHDIHLNVDQTRIFAVFTNLLSNAIKFTPEYGWIRISSKKEEDHYLFEVKDNGIGLAQDEMGRLFKKFERIKPPIMNDHINIKDSGTGLGLYITKGIIIAHGGKIWANSDGENQGSTFSFTVPN